MTSSWRKLREKWKIMKKQRAKSQFRKIAIFRYHKFGIFWYLFQISTKFNSNQSCTCLHVGRIFLIRWRVIYTSHSDGWRAKFWMIKCRTTDISEFRNCPKIENFKNESIFQFSIIYEFGKWSNIRNCSIWKIKEFFKFTNLEFFFTIWKINI